MEQQKYLVYGELRIPVYFIVYSHSKQTALNQSIHKLNNKTIQLLDGDLHTTDGKSHPIIAPNLSVVWVEAKLEDEL